MRAANDTDFAELFTTDAPVVVDVWADWCGPCKAFAPTFEAAAANHDDLVFAKVDIEASPAVAARYDVMSIPTVLFLNPDGTEISRIVGSVSAAAFEAQLVGLSR